MKQIKSILYLLLFLPSWLLAQGDNKTFIEGKVAEKISAKETEPLIGANVYWLNTNIGTTTDVEGAFSIEKSNTSNKLVISYVGFQADTIEVINNKKLSIELTRAITGPEVEVKSRKKSTEISILQPLKIERIGEKELMKAACCDLSESFETSPSVDVSFTDAITGTRQIQLLGLSGPYTQITREFMPDVRGLAAIYGLQFTPGTWVESMQLNKGTGTVVNGFESVAGQINVELRKPENSDRLYFNTYFNELGRLELNLNLATDVGKDWATGLLLHGKKNSIRWDRNNDGFLEMPLSDEFVALHRWKYISPSGGMIFQAGLKGSFLNNIAGQEDFDENTDEGSTSIWGTKYNVNRLEAWTKLGFLFENTPWKSIGIQMSTVRHRQESFYGLNNYDATQTGFYGNFIYQSILSNTNHKFKTGFSFQYDYFLEVFNERNFNRREAIPGAFFEYTYNYKEKLGLVAGLRVDNHNLFGTFLTPRIHFRYAVAPESIFRASFGRGQRTATILAENVGLLASNREIIIQEQDNNLPYGLNPEIAWNYGINFTQLFRLYNREASISFDFYRTDFENQIVVDLDQSPQEVLFYNLNDKSYSNSFQVQLDYELLPRFDVRLAYRWFDVKTTFSGQLLEKPLIAAHRAFINLAYATNNNWRFDYTTNWQGSKRIPFTGSNPEAFQLAERSPDFIMVNAQISKSWEKKDDPNSPRLFEVYLGVENLFNFRQDNPILSSEDPFSPFFDSSLVWGPVFGRNVYVGLRYRLK